ncbi:hypothetical protein P7C73_g5699, partial [Tremellales sp. Uapishka_1]
MGVCFSTVRPASASRERRLTGIPYSTAPEIAVATSPCASSVVGVRAATTVAWVSDFCRVSDHPRGERGTDGWPSLESEVRLPYAGTDLSRSDHCPTSTACPSSGPDPDPIWLSPISNPSTPASASTAFSISKPVLTATVPPRSPGRTNGRTRSKEGGQQERTYTCEHTTEKADQDPPRARLSSAARQADKLRTNPNPDCRKNKTPDDLPRKVITAQPTHEQRASLPLHTHGTPPNRPIPSEDPSSRSRHSRRCPNDPVEIEMTSRHHREKDSISIRPSKKNKDKNKDKDKDAKGRTPSSNPASRLTKPKRLLSKTEILYPTPEAASAAFRAEREMNNNNLRRRAPTPGAGVRKTNSENTLRSTVSFDSTRSGRSGRSRHQNGDDGSEVATVGIGPYDAHFGAAMGTGPIGEAIEVIGLGRKEPRHRTFQSGMLKPALRSSSRVNSRAEMREQRSQTAVPLTRSFSRPQTRNQHHFTEKPLPSRPMSYVAPVIDTLFRSGTSTRNRSNSHARQNSTPHSTSRRDEYPTWSSSNPAPSGGSGLGLRSLFSSLAMNDPAPPTRRESRIIAPADDLHTYLRLVEVPSWDKWPGQPKGLFGKAQRGFNDMGWEWRKRWDNAEMARMAGRALRIWEGTSGARYWERIILDFQEEHVPTRPIDALNRWGAQIFALPAEGYDTLEFFDEAAHDAEDYGLLSWLTGSVLQTAVSTLHMLRYSSSSFTFHLIPTPSPSPSPAEANCLYEGFGTLVLVDRQNNLERSMVIEVRPPSLVDTATLREFGKTSRNDGWWHLPGEMCVGDVGQANLLQAQTYDDCVQNGVYFFAVTNLKYWVFGSFVSEIKQPEDTGSGVKQNSAYSKCTVSPMIDRRAREPSVMQCLTAWLIRSVDEVSDHLVEAIKMYADETPERPRGSETMRQGLDATRASTDLPRSGYNNDSRPYDNPRPDPHLHRAPSRGRHHSDVPPYTTERTHRHSHQRNPSYQEYTPSPASASMNTYGLPNYYDVPPPPLYPAWGANAASPIHPSRAFSPPQPQPFGNWYSANNSGFGWGMGGFGR